jgi:23S rRNA pseudouridine1911/1915/1917 synthase
MLMQPQIIYEDDNVLVVAKPAGMLVHPTVKLEPDTLYGFVKNYYADAHLDLGVHPVFRLDRFTSGLVLFAKQAKVQAQLSGQAVTKEYLALVTGNLPAEHGIIDAPIARKPGSIVERCVSAAGKPALTEYWQLGRHGDVTLVRLKLWNRTYTSDQGASCLGGLSFMERSLIRYAGTTKPSRTACA